MAKEIKIEPNKESDVNQLMKNIAPILASWSEFTKIKNKAINQKALAVMAKSFAKTIKTVSLPDNVKDAIQAQTKIAQSIAEVNEGLQINFSNILADLKRVFESIPTPYSEEENKEIMAGLETMANKGWVTYFNYAGDFRVFKSGLSDELELEWLKQLSEDASDDNIYQELINAGCYSKPLLDSMLQSYRSENYYAAYTLATVAIDGVITRFSEIQSNARFMPVGCRAVEELDDSLLNKPIVDLGFFKWLYQFFKDTKRFTLDEPNRHMIGHGRWDKELNQVQFLKLFNVMLYLAFRFEIWRHVLGESLSD